MAKRDIKVACKINQKIDGLAHIVEDEFGNFFSVWYGVIEIKSTPEDWKKLVHQEIQVHLEDGRTGIAKAIGGDAKSIFMATGDESPGDTFLLCIIGLSDLKIRNPPPHERASRR